MKKYRDKLRALAFTISVVVALVILIDFMLPGKVVMDKIIDVKRERQQYYNAAKNYHYTYKVITSKHHFFVTQEFAQIVENNQQIEYSVSLIFNEINRYGLPSSEDRDMYSLRIISGFIVPLMAIVAIGLAYKYEERISTLVFVLIMLLIADLVFLMT